MATIEIQVAASGDDCRAYYDGAAWQFGNSSIGQQVGYYVANFYKIGGGMRFTNVTIPAGSTIDTAYLKLTCRDGALNGTIINSKLRGEQSNNAAAFSDYNDYYNRPRTSAIVSWNNIPQWTLDQVYNSPEIKAIIQELVNDYGGLSAANIVIFWDDHDDLSTHGSLCYRDAYSRDGSATKAPVLHIEYTPVEQVIEPTGIEQAIAIGTVTLTQLRILIEPTGIEQPAAVGTPALSKVTPEVPDLPDWMFTMNLAATRLVMPINVQGVSVTVPIEIKAVTVESISVDIVAQTVGNVTISVAAQAVGVYLQPEWAAKEGQDKNFIASATNATWGQVASGTYTVPTGKALYICGISGQIEADMAANYDHHLYSNVWLLNETTDVTLAIVGGLGGGSLIFPKPIKVPAGIAVTYKIVNRSNISCNLAVTMWGYEV